MKFRVRCVSHLRRCRGDGIENVFGFGPEIVFGPNPERWNGSIDIVSQSSDKFIVGSFYELEIK